mgnify:FL=1
MELNPESRPDSNPETPETQPEVEDVNRDISRDPGLENNPFDNAFENKTVGQEGEPPYIGPEETEIYHSPEDTIEIEPGVGPRPSWDAPPDDPVVIPDIQAPDGPSAQDVKDVNDPGNQTPPEIPEIKPDGEE